MYIYIYISQVTSSPISRGSLWGSHLSWQILFLALRASRRVTWSCVWSVAGLCCPPHWLCQRQGWVRVCRMSPRTRPQNSR